MLSLNKLAHGISCKDYIPLVYSGEYITIPYFDFLFLYDYISFSFVESGLFICLSTAAVIRFLFYFIGYDYSMKRLFLE